MRKFAPTLLLVATGAFGLWIGSAWPQERNATPLMIAAAAAIVTGVLVLLLLGHAAADGGRDSTAITHSRVEERTSAVYIVMPPSPTEQHHYHHYDGSVTVRHEVAGSVRYTHAHQHTHTLGAGSGGSGGSNGSGYDDARYLAGEARRALPAPPRVFGIERPAPRQLEARGDDW